MGGYVYILSSRTHSVLYTGVTNDIARRIYEHQEESIDGFSKEYKIKKLVFVEYFNDIRDAIAAEKTMKAWSRKKKDALINKLNPEWKDLSETL